MHADHRSIIRALGGITALSDRLGLRRRAVASWNERNSIPGWHWPRVAKAAAEIGASVTMDDLATAARPRKLTGEVEASRPEAGLAPVRQAAAA